MVLRRSVGVDEEEAEGCEVNGVQVLWSAVAGSALSK